MHHPRADIERLYIKPQNDGSGLIQQELTYKTITIRLKKHLDTTTDRMHPLVNIHTQEAKEKYIQLVKKVINMLNNSTSNKHTHKIVKAQKGKKKEKAQGLNQLKNVWKGEKSLQGQ